MEYGKKLFLDLTGLFNQKNREFLYKVNDTLYDVTKEIVKGIQQNSELYEPLYQVVIKKSWGMLESTADYQIRGDENEKEKFKYNIVTCLRLLGIISPLVRQFQTST